MIEASNVGKFTPPRHLVVLGHPDPNSFCASVARAYCEEVRLFGQEAMLRDLYALDFDPRLAADERSAVGRGEAPSDIAEDVALLRQADIVTLVYPIWFGMPPAIIKGYVDRVLGVDFDTGTIGRDEAAPGLAGKRLMLLTASASTRPWLEEKGQWVALRHAFETYLRGIFGLRDAGHVHFDAIVPDAKPQFVEECLSATRERARAVSAEMLSEKRAAQSAKIRQAEGS